MSHSTHIPVVIRSSKDRSYDLTIGRALTSNVVATVRSLRPASCVVITDSHITKTHAVLLKSRLARVIPKTFLLTIPHGERSKNQKTKTMLEHAMLKYQCGRDTVIVALGGGVVGDLAGFVAATYLRGIPYIQVPTTLLAMLDSSIGGKTGIDTAYGKNMIGAFWQPKHVIINVDYLQTLPTPQINAGLIEAVKMFMTMEPSSLVLARRYHATHRWQDALPVIRQAILLKASVVSRDETEQAERMVLNFGHTIGHALEKLSGYRMHHGLAVGLGVLVESKIAQLKGILPKKDFECIQEILNEWNLPMNALRRYSASQIIAATKSDKKVRAGSPRYVLLEKMGKVYKDNKQFAHPVPDAIVKKAIEFIRHFEA